MKAKVGFCIVVRSACDAWQPARGLTPSAAHIAPEVLTGAVFNLVNGDQHEVARESHFLPRPDLRPTTHGSRGTSFAPGPSAVPDACCWPGSSMHKSVC